MSGLFTPVLFLHVLGSIVALGPTFAFPVIGSMAGREPEHGNFATRLASLIDDRVVLPFVLLTGATGAALVWLRNVPVFEAPLRWLLLSIVLYAAAMAFALLVQRPAVKRVIDLTSKPGDPGPELGRATARVARSGAVLLVLAVAVTFLMVVKPSLAF